RVQAQGGVEVVQGAAVFTAGGQGRAAVAVTGRLPRPQPDDLRKVGDRPLVVTALGAEPAALPVGVGEAGVEAQGGGVVGRGAVEVAQPVPGGAAEVVV